MLPFIFNLTHRNREDANIGLELPVIYTESKFRFYDSTLCHDTTHRTENHHHRSALNITVILTDGRFSHHFTRWYKKDE